MEPTDRMPVDAAATNNDSVEEGLAFLVTDYLARRYASTTLSEEDVPQHRRIRRATAELMDALGHVGAFGRRETTSSAQSNRSFADVARQWSATDATGGGRLEALVQAVTTAAEPAPSTNSSDDATPNRNTQKAILSLMQAALERQQQQQSSTQQQQRGGGRTIADAIAVDASSSSSSTEMVPFVPSALHRPPLPAKYQSVWLDVAQAVRTLAQARHDHVQAVSLRHTWQASRQFQTQRWNELKEQALILQQQQPESDAAKSVEERFALLEINQQDQQQCERVLHQLQRSMEQQPSHLLEFPQSQLVSARTSFGRAKALGQSYQNAWPRPSPLVSLVTRRSMGMPSLACARGLPRLSPEASMLSTTIRQRWSHAVTINAHLAYPIYCLRVKGRFFITGSDDHLVKVFSLQRPLHSKDQPLQPVRQRQTALQYLRGAVLVCTLKGHAGVINDMDISADQALLATASEDGDVRVWALRDGTPVAILRGHEGGANMVRWSTLTPYRLVTSGADGLARNWDIRQACLDRYGSVLGRRPEYRGVDTTTNASASGAPVQADVPPVVLPPLPARGGTMAESNHVASAPSGPASDAAEHSDATNDVRMGEINDEGDAIPVPPLPPAPNDNNLNPVDPASANEDSAPGQNNNDLIADPILNDAEPGDFVANDAIDRGVKILAKLQHGASLAERVGNGPGTRARRAAVKVISVSRCPLGGHFATGSDDGICRIWRDEDDAEVEAIDRAASKGHLFSDQSDQLLRIPTGQQQPLLTLTGHLGAVTDLQYSQLGDRLMSASQKDGIVRIWSWSKDPAAPRSSESPCKTSHIIIKLTSPKSNSVSADQQQRRQRRRTTEAQVSCDVASWVCDDSKIVTSQCELLKKVGGDIVPGSQFIFLWDSFTGSCLLGIAGAHATQCPVLMPHPKLPNIICTAATDGIAKLWDWESGKCIFSHKNTIHHGPIDPRDLGQVAAGYLDGHFTADGTGMILTDDNGRVSVFDCFAATSGQSDKDAPSWMKEQYFANDYYELVYEASGHCIERGSGLPPHRAPKGARCSHTGAPFADPINLAFRKLSGPRPAPEHVSRWKRQVIRGKAATPLVQKVLARGPILKQYDPSTTIIVNNSKIVETKVPTGGPLPSQDRSVDDARSPAIRLNDSPARRPPQRLSSNWRWRDYSDILQEDNQDEEEHDTDDEYLEPAARRSDRAMNEEHSDSDDDSLMLDDETSPVRASNRNLQRHFEDGEDSETESVVEFMSTNNTPSGPFVNDYDTHHFKLSRTRHVERDWVMRSESTSSYTGIKKYTPQAGDSVVYIAKAHLETLENFPSLAPPWQRWPRGADWPVVRCEIIHVRYRFPFKAYTNQSKGIVAIVTLKISGIPLDSPGRVFGWPEASFAEPESSSAFEVCLFDSEWSDFLVPESLYVERVTKLEQALQNRDQPAVKAFYAKEGGGVDDEVEPFPGVIIEHTYHQDSVPHLSGSGYRQIVVKWPDDPETDNLSPWELVVDYADDGVPSRPCLSSEEEKRVREALVQVEAIPGAKNAFMKPVNERTFSDYSSRVEVPMYLTFINNRLNNDYYSSREGVASDLRLIHVDCVKYNGEDHELSSLAATMCEKFEELVFDPEERDILTQHVRIVHELAAQDGAQRAESAVPRSRQRMQPSVLVNLRTSERQRQPRVASQTSNQPENARRSARAAQRRSSLETLSESSGRRASARNVAVAPAPSLGSNQNRGRTTSRAGRQVAGLAQRQSRAAEVAAVAANGRTRRTRALADRADDTIEESRVDDEIPRVDPSADVVARSGRAARAARRQSAEALPEDAESAGDDESEVPARTRRRSGSSRRYREMDSDEDLEAEDNADESEAEDSDQEVPESESDESMENYDVRRSTRRSGRSTRNENAEPNRRTRGSSGNTRSSPTRAASRRNAVGQSYADPSESEFGSDASDDEPAEETPSHRSRASSSGRASRNKNSSRKRSGSSSSNRRRKKTRRDESDDDDSEEGTNSSIIPSPKPWPKIDIRQITDVTKNILRRLSSIDSDEIFARPVAEAFPEVADAYSAVIEQPMDFRTIEEDRMQYYQNITELQDDLILCFRNCIHFNETDSDLGQLAITLLEALEGIFRQACNESGTTIPRRW